VTGEHRSRILSRGPTPAYVLDLGRLRANLAVLGELQEVSGAKILLALKAFAMWSAFPPIRETLAGVCASSPWEARLGREEFGGEVHGFAAALSEGDLGAMLAACDHLSLNSFAQLERFRPRWQGSGVSVGLRVNPEHREGHTALYDPCAPGSRLGIRRAEFSGRSLEGVEGLHFHTLCEHLFPPLERTAAAFEEKFGAFLPGMRWLNLGGGHHLTREGYDRDGLAALVQHFTDTYGVQVYLEPGEAVVLDAGLLVTTVLDVVDRDGPIAILDTSAACHMPDVLEMPYRPPLFGAGEPGEKPHAVRLAGPSCLAGDVIGEWSFDTPLRPGDRLAFGDMALYTMVKNTAFNGVQLPAICTYEPDTGELTVVRRFGYEDFRGRLS
jgi:carboxynorspermidine decarboxylase